MRSLIIAAAFTLTACGQAANPEAPAQNAEAQVAATGGMDLSGHLIAVGTDFRLDADPVQNVVVLVFPDNDQTVSGPYVAPQATDTGAQLQSGGVTLTLTPQTCTHEGAVYPMRARVDLINARPAEGCALVRWDHHLLELMPQIDACIAASPETRWVSYAGRTGDDDVTMRLQGNQRSVQCVVRGQRATVSPTPENARIAGDAEALFVRGPGENPGGECYEAPEVRSASGEMLGWMMDPQGC